MRNRFSPLKNNRGSAIMFSMFLMSLLVFLAFEVSYDTVVELENSLNSVRKVQAYYAAKGCTDISLLRIKAYQQAARSGLAKSLPDPSMLDLVWQFPLSWPIVAPSDSSEGDKSAIAKTMKASTFKHQFNSKINSESGKIDINDLASPSEGIRKKTKQQILDLFSAKLREQSEWSNRYSNFQFDRLINNISDWIDPDRDSQNGGSEDGYYSEMRSPYIPPNEPFKTIEELHMVDLMEDDIYNVLAPQITLYGGKGINVNYATGDLLMALDVRITKEVAQEIIKRRNDPNLGGPFRDEKDFVGFLGQFGIGADFNEDKVPLYFDNEINFNVSCIGVVGKISTEMTSYVFDFQKVQSRLASEIAKDPKNQNPNNPGSTVNPEQCKDKVGEPKFDCLCQDKTNADEKKKCVDARRAAEASGGQAGERPLPQGPPYVIFRDVK
ncbi:MAG: general secretion pathway protein GspK [Bdellovibrionales bacterium]|nr:general secretion pathway protein GspK [Bdellovibrionales bacterium]